MVTLSLGLPLLVPSVSLPEPAPRMVAAKEVWRDRSLRPAGSCSGRGDPPGRGVNVPGVALCLCFNFLRLDSLPLASERFGEPGRLREELATLEGFLSGSPCFSLRPEGVFVPLVEAPDAGFSPSLPLSFVCACNLASSSFLRSSSLARSVSESSDSLC
jgi:hypothetical protein